MATTGSAQPDIVLPGHAEIDTWVPDSGLPMTDLWLELHGDFRDIPMPPGPKGPDGPPGRPRATFVKMGAIANEAARPAVLGRGARGWWWHRIDTNGMDVWCGDHWQHSPNAVGAPGPVARPNTLTPLPVLRDERYTMAAARVRGRKPDNQTIEYTVPAGERGARGPNGNVFGTAITDAPDYDDTYGPINGSMFAYSRVTRRFRALARPANGYGPYHFGANVFDGPANISPLLNGGPYVVAPKTIATLVIPPMPFAWRPMVHGMVRTAQLAGGNILTMTFTPLRFTVRLNADDGEQVAIGTNPYVTSPTATQYTEIDTTCRPFYGEVNGVNIRRNPKYGVVPAYEEAALVVRLECIPNKLFFDYATSGAFATVWVVPVAPNSGLADPTARETEIVVPEGSQYS